MGGNRLVSTTASSYFAVKFSLSVYLSLSLSVYLTPDHSTKDKQIPVALHAAPAGHHPPEGSSPLPPPPPPLHFPPLHVDLYILHTKKASPRLYFSAARLRHQTAGDSFIFDAPRWSRKIAPSILLIKWWRGEEGINDSSLFLPLSPLPPFSTYTPFSTHWLQRAKKGGATCCRHGRLLVLASLSKSRATKGGNTQEKEGREKKYEWDGCKIGERQEW